MNCKQVLETSNNGMSCNNEMDCKNGVYCKTGMDCKYGMDCKQLLETSKNGMDENVNWYSFLTSKISPTDSNWLSPKSTLFNSGLFWRSESSIASTSLCDKKAILSAGFALNKLPGSDLI